MKTWEYILLVVVLMLSSGCQSLSLGLTSSSENQECRTTLVFGFAIIRQPLNQGEKTAQSSSLRSIGIAYDSEKNLMGAGYLHDMRTTIYNPENKDIIIEAVEKNGDLKVESETVNKNKEVK